MIITIIGGIYLISFDDRGLAEAYGVAGVTYYVT